MTIDRRSLLAAGSGLIVWPVLAKAQNKNQEQAQDKAHDTSGALQTYERDTGGRIGLYAENLATGAKITWRADERFVMCSSFKASLAAFVLSRVDRGQDHLDAMISYGPNDLLDYAPVARQNLGERKEATLSVAEMCKASVELSDNTCANLLLARVGGPAEPDRILAGNRR